MGSYVYGRCRNVFSAGDDGRDRLRVDYLMIYEKHISGTKRNGHFLNTGLSINFNLIYSVDENT
jgi:hypothetical protein